LFFWGATMTYDIKCFTHNITNTIDATSCTSYYISQLSGSWCRITPHGIQSSQKKEKPEFKSIKPLPRFTDPQDHQLASQNAILLNGDHSMTLSCDTPIQINNCYTGDTKQVTRWLTMTEAVDSLSAFKTHWILHNELYVSKMSWFSHYLYKTIYGIEVI